MHPFCVKEELYGPAAPVFDSPKTWNNSRHVVMMLEACRQHARWHTRHAYPDRNKKWQFHSSKYCNHKHPHSHTILAHQTTMIHCPLQQRAEQHIKAQYKAQSGWKLHHSSKPSHSFNRQTDSKCEVSADKAQHLCTPESNSSNGCQKGASLLLLTGSLTDKRLQQAMLATQIPHSTVYCAKTIMRPI